MNTSKDLGQIEFWNQFILDGDQEALSHIYFHYYDFLFDYGRKHTSNKQMVEDAIQDIFISFIKARKRIGIVKNLNGYLIATFRRQLFLDLNKQRKTILTENLAEESFDYFRSTDEDISEIGDREQLYLTIKQCVSKLTNKQKEIMFLRFESGISYTEIAEILNISVDSCYKSIYRSINAIKSEAEKVLVKGGDILLWVWLRSVK